MARDPICEAIDEVVGPATPHFAYQLRARVRELIEDLPPDHPARRYGEEKMELPRPARPRLLEGRGGRARGARAAGLGHDPELRARGRAASPPVVSFEGEARSS